MWKFPTSAFTTTSLAAWRRRTWTGSPSSTAPAVRRPATGRWCGQIDAVAGAVAAQGLGVHGVAAILCPNVPAFAVVFHGLLRAGATVTTVNSLYTADEIAHQLADAGADVAVHRLRAAPRRPGGRRPGRDPGRTARGARRRRRPPLAAGPADARAPRHRDVSFDPATHVAVLPYSSGTTGRPKGVMLSHRNLVANVEQSRGLLDVAPEDRLLALLPFFHIYGLTVLLNLALRQRACLVTMPQFELAEFLRIIQDHKCSYLFIAPPVAVALSKHPLVADYDLSSVHTTLSGAAPLDGELGERLAERLGCRVLQGYGMTEMSPVSHLIPVDAAERPRQLGGLHGPEHAVPAGGPGHRGGHRGSRGGHQRAGAPAVPRAERDARLPQPARGNRGHPGRRRLPAHRGHRHGAARTAW